MMKRLLLLFGSLLAALLVTAAGTVAAAPLTKVNVLLPVPNIDESFAPFVVAKYLGYFAAEGLDVNLIAVAGSNEAAIEVSAGNAEIGVASPAEAVIGLQTGQKLDVQYFYALYYRSIWSISVPPDSPVHGIAELKGKKLGVIGMGSAGISFGRAFLTQAGLDPDRDITFIPIGVGARAMTAVRQKLVDGIVFTEAMLAKFKVTGSPMRVLPADERLASLPDAAILARRETIEKNPKLLIGVARAVDKGYIFNQANPEAAVRITWNSYPEAEPKNVPPETALEEGVTVNQARMSIWSSPKTGGVDGKFIEADWNNLVQFMLQQGMLKEAVPVNRIYTQALLTQINEFDRAPILAQAKAFDPKTLK